MRAFPFLLFFLLLSSITWAQAVPPSPIGYVLDTAGVLTSAQIGDIESRLNALEQSATVEIAVYIFPSLEGGDMFEYTQRVFDTWKIGQSGKNNGLLITIATQDRAWRIHTGYGVEGAVPDALAYKIGQKKMVPFLAEGKYYDGIMAALDDIEGIVKENPEVVAEYTDAPVEFELFDLGFRMAILAVLLLVGIVWKIRKQIPSKNWVTVGTPNFILLLLIGFVISFFLTAWGFFLFNGLYPFTFLSGIYAYWLLFSSFPWKMISGKNTGMGSGMFIGGMGGRRGSGGFGGGSFGGGGFGGGMSGGGGAGGRF
ncbi:MAG: TPM domain-containing protein [Candidatus Diapherotrites archaeon]